MRPFLDVVYQYEDTLSAFMNLAIAWLVVRETRRMRVPHTPLALALVTFFTLRAFSDLNDQPGLYTHAQVDLERMIDGLLVMVLGYLFLRSNRIGSMASAAVAAARTREREYQRARRDYAELVRHRMFNPLAVIRGAAITLRDGALGDEHDRERLCDAIVEMSHQLEDLTLEAESMGGVEAGLDPKPRV